MAHPITPDTTSTEIRAIFEKHTVPEEGDPELLMFDTDAIIADIEAYVAQKEKALLDTISKHLPEAQPITHDLQHQQKMWRLGYSQAIDDINKLLTTNKKGKV